MALVECRKEGLYIPGAKVYVDPWRRVNTALITHGHSDHARWGHHRYICTHASKPILRHRLGDVSISSVAFAEELFINGIKITFLPAGHIIGSAQVRIEHRGEIWVISGDYKVEDDGISGTFEPIRCHTFITECTFGSPVYSWIPQERIFDQINDWWASNRAHGITSILTAYSLGKAQRLLHGLDQQIGLIYCSGAVDKMNQAIRSGGVELPSFRSLNGENNHREADGQIIITSRLGVRDTWMGDLSEISVGSASGWVQIRGNRMGSSGDRSFALSDHADWEGLNQTIEATGAERIYVTHGSTGIFGRWLKERGYDARILPTRFAGESDIDYFNEPQIT